MHVKPSEPCLALAASSKSAAHKIPTGAWPEQGRCCTITGNTGKDEHCHLRKHVIKEKIRKRHPETRQDPKRASRCLSSHQHPLTAPNCLFKAQQSSKLLAGAPRRGTCKGWGSAHPSTRHRCSEAAPMGEQWVPRAPPAALCWDAPWKRERGHGNPHQNRCTPWKNPFASTAKHRQGTPCENKASSPRHAESTGSVPAGSVLPFHCQASSCSNLWPPLSRIQPTAAHLFLISLLQTSKVQPPFI